MSYDDSHIMVAAFDKPIKLIDINTMEISSLPEDSMGMGRVLKSKSFIPTDLCRASNGMIWIGTVINGLLRYNPADSSFTSISGTACADISAIREDADSSLWISTLYGLSHYHPDKGTFEHFYDKDGMAGIRSVGSPA